jgi:lysophospholipase L1-like esterase
MIDYASSREAHDPYCLDAGEAARLLSGHPWKRFVVIGDSVASGVGDPVDGYLPVPWCDRIASELAATTRGFEYLNLGERELRAFEVREQQLDKALAFKPDLALVVCGGNDALRKGYNPEAVDAELATIINTLRETGAVVMTVGMFDTSFAPIIRDAVRGLVSARMRRLSNGTAQVGAEYGTIHVNLTGHPMESDPGMYSADGLHGNLRCHGICAAEAVRALGAYLGRDAKPLAAPFAPAAPERAAVIAWLGPLIASLVDRSADLTDFVVQLAAATVS